MKCEQAAKLIARALGDRSDERDAHELEDHIAGCAACQAEAAAYQDLLRALAAADIPDVESEGATRGLARLLETIQQYEHELSSTKRRDTFSSPVFRRITQVAAAVAFVAVGSAIGALYERARRPEARPATPVTADSAAGPAQQRFLVLMRSRDRSARTLLRAWGNSLDQEGRLVNGAGAEFGEPVVMGADLRTAPYQLYLDGYMIITARDWEEARRIVSAAPNIAHGGGVEVFRLR